MPPQEQDGHMLAEGVALLRRERPHARAFIEPFVGLLLARPALVEALLADVSALPAPTPELSRLGQGACIEPRDAFPVTVEALARSFEALHPVLNHAFRAARGDLMVLGQAAAADEHLLPQAASDMLGDRHQALRRTACRLGVEPKTFGFWCVQLLTPLALARGRQLAGGFRDEHWNRGYCPVCGSWPGYRRLMLDGWHMTCSFCATTWLFNRMDCPYCEAQAPPADIFSVPGFESERVTVCSRCNHYIGEFEAKALAACPPEVAGLALTPLELMARQQGSVPGSLDWRQMPWA